MTSGAARSTNSGSTRSTISCCRTSRLGTRRFVELFTEAKQDYDVFLQDRLALEMQRFLPGTEYPFPLEDVVASVLAEFATWLA